MADSPTRQLADEHEYVKLVVGAMEAEAAFIERTGRVHAERVTQMIDFTRNFTDGDHHTKEEDLLFPLLEERSASAGGTISVLLSEHEAARDCIRAIDEALPVAEGADPSARRRGARHHRREPAAVRLPAAAAHRQGGHRPLPADRRGAQRARAGDARRGLRPSRRGPGQSRDHPEATTGWRTSSRRRRRTAEGRHEAAATSIGIFVFDGVELLDFAGPLRGVHDRVAPVPARQPRARAGAVRRVHRRPDGRAGPGPCRACSSLPDHAFAGLPRRSTCSSCPAASWVTSSPEPRPSSGSPRCATRTSITSSSAPAPSSSPLRRLLDGRRATTHWEDVDDLRARWPSVAVEEGARWIDEGGIVTAAGISAGIDMSLHLVERLAGRDLALRTAHHMDYSWVDEG